MEIAVAFILGMIATALLYEWYYDFTTPRDS